MDSSSNRKHSSRAAKRKKKKEKDEKEAAPINNVMPISSFFKKARNEEEDLELANASCLEETPCTSYAQPELTAASFPEETEKSLDQTGDQTKQDYASSVTIISEDPAL